MHRTIHAIDAVKMVVVDLDDTLWRGLIGEGTAGDLEGWPVGFSEALLQLKKRGILLAIVSKNDEAVVRANWTKVLGSTMSLEDFAIVRINYRPKPDNMAEVLNLANITSRSVVFVDDNPVEREAMKAAFPDIRVLGDLPLYFKRTLMWSSETQVAHLSSESVRRTEMVQAQAVREGERVAMSREEFLANLGLAVEVETIDNVDHPKFARAFELINKTNQFNTTGIRMTHTEAVEWIAAGNVLHIFSARDKHTSYGLVGVLTCSGGFIEQFVMSCRVAGLDIELGVLSLLINTAAAGYGHWRARLVHTDVNLLCREVYAKSGFRKVGDADGEETWIREPGEPVSCPAHLDISADGLRII